MSLLDSWRFTDKDYKNVENNNKDLMKMIGDAEENGFQIAAIGDPQSGKIHHVIAQDKNDKLPQVLTDRPLNS